jgi:hypothetical protein
VSDETVLTGGNISTVVRAGDTVRRPTGPWSPAVHALLTHLAASGYDAAPRTLGSDEQGREILTYLDGDVFDYPMPDRVWDEPTLEAVVLMMRRLHDITAHFTPPPNARWRLQPGAPTSGPVICHNDIAPYNTVFRGGIPVAFIDWDFATPGPALWDLTHAAWLWVPLDDAPDVPALDAPRRLRMLCDAYGLPRDGRAAILTTIQRRQQVAHDVIVEWGTRGVPGFDRLLKDGHHRGKLASMRWLETHRVSLERALQL